MQEVTYNDFNKTLEKINNYSTFDLLKTLIKYKVIPEFINFDLQNIIFTYDDRINEFFKLNYTQNECDTLEPDEENKYSTFALYAKYYYEYLNNNSSGVDVGQKEEILNIDYGETCFDNKKITVDEVYNIFKNKFKNQFITHFDLLTEQFKLLGKFDITKNIKEELKLDGSDAAQYGRILILDIQDKEEDEIYTQFIISLSNIEIDNKAY